VTGPGTSQFTPPGLFRMLAPPTASQSRDLDFQRLQAFFHFCHGHGFTSRLSRLTYACVLALGVATLDIVFPVQRSPPLSGRPSRILSLFPTSDDRLCLLSAPALTAQLHARAHRRASPVQ